jgi:cobalt-zinc-cadmium efflux system membrane fusion protein
MEEGKTRDEARVARDRLRLYGLSEAEIDAVKDEDGEAKARFTLRSPLEGQVMATPVELGDLADAKSVLAVIAKGNPSDGEGRGRD